MLDIAALSENDLAFYCLDVTELDIMAYLLPCYYAHCLTDITGTACTPKSTVARVGRVIEQVNHLLRQANLPGQFPLLVAIIIAN